MSTLLPYYDDSDDDEIREEKLLCVLCGQEDDDPIVYGEKITKNEVTAHFFCLVRIDEESKMV